MSKKVLPFRGLNHLAERLKKARDIMKLSQGEVAETFGVSVVAVSNWERGKVEPPLGYLAYLVEKHSFNLSWLLFGKGWIRLTEVESYFKTGFKLLPHRDRENYKEDERLKSQIFKAGIKTFLVFEDLNNDRYPTIAGIEKKLNMKKDSLRYLLLDDDILPEKLQRDISAAVDLPLGFYEVVMAAGREVLQLPAKDMLSVVNDVQKVVYEFLKDHFKDARNAAGQLTEYFATYQKEVKNDDINWKEKYYEESEAHKRTLLELNHVRKEKEELQRHPTALAMETASSISLDD